MKRPLFIGIFLMAAVLIAFYLAFLQPPAVPDKNGGKSFSVPNTLEHVPLLRVRRSKSVTIARLQSPTQIDGFPCAAGWIHFTDSGRLRAFYLGETSIIQGHQIPEGTWIRLDPDLALHICSFPEDTTIQGHRCDGGFGGSEGVNTSFYPSGRLKAFFAPNDVEIAGIPCKASLFTPIYLHENGNLKEFTIARDTGIGGRALSPWQTVVLSEQGEIQSVSGPAFFMQARDWITKLFR